MPTYDLLLAAQRRDADTAPVADGANHSLYSNATGRLKVSATPAAITQVTGNITASAQNVAADVSRVSNVIVEINGTFTGLNVTFETSIDGGTTWKAEQGVRSNAATIESTSGVIATGLAYRWEFSVNSISNFRVRSTAFTSGTAAVVIGLGAFATEPFVTVPTHGVTQSGTWNMGTVTPGTAATNLGKAEDTVATTGDVGVGILGVRNDAPLTTKTDANGDYGHVAMDGTGTLYSRDKPSPTSAVTTVAGSASSVTVLASNASRRGASVYNDSSVILYLKLGATASSTSFTIKMAAESYYEVPAAYTGVIDGIWASATGNARVTEIS